MFETTFNPGPSKISAATYVDIQNFYQQKLGEISHRTAKFSEISESAVMEMKKYFSIPDDYQIIWGTSATEMMELVIQAAVKKESFHVTCGSFSERWQKISASLGKISQSDAVEWGQKNNLENLSVPASAELVAITQSETSTGVGISNEEILAIRKKNPDKILAVDATSIMGAKKINIADADVWVFSVQKCFGLPAGLGVMIYSPRFLEKSQAVENTSGALNFFARHKKMAQNFQTVQTANLLPIYLLSQQLKRWNKNGGIKKIESDTAEKNNFLADLVSKIDGIEFFIPEKKDRSTSVNCLKISAAKKEKILEQAAIKKIIIGGGYGKLKSETIRIANFPNILLEEYKRLIEMF